MIGEPILEKNLVVRALFIRDKWLKSWCVQAAFEDALD